MDISTICSNNPNNNTFVIVALVKTFLESQFLSFIPYLIQEVVDSKSLITNYVEELVGLKEMHVFMFFVDNNE